MAAGVRKLAIYESKPGSGFGCRGTGSCLTDFAKERNFHVASRPPVSALREHTIPRISSALFDLEVAPQRRIHISETSVLCAVRRGGGRFVRHGREVCRSATPGGIAYSSISNGEAGLPLLVMFNDSERMLSI